MKRNLISHPNQNHKENYEIFLRINVIVLPTRNFRCNNNLEIYLFQSGKSNFR